MAWGHLDVGDHQLWPPGFDESKEAGGVLRRAHDLEARLDKQSRESFAQ
jgi:hypothetical protein